MTQTIIHLQRLALYGVAFHSYTEPHLATDNELVRNILLALLSSLAKVEAQKISERTRAGMSRTRAKDVKIGRPKLPAELRRIAFKVRSSRERQSMSFVFDHRLPGVLRALALSKSFSAHCRA